MAQPYMGGHVLLCVGGRLFRFQACRRQCEHCESLTAGQLTVHDIVKCGTAGNPCSSVNLLQSLTGAAAAEQLSVVLPGYLSSRHTGNCAPAARCGSRAVLLFQILGRGRPGFSASPAASATCR